MVTIKTPKEINILRQGGHKLAVILQALARAVKPGVDTGFLEQMANDLIIKVGGTPSFKGYDMGDGIFFPTALCASINNEVVHGPALPARILKSGDIIDLDIGMKWQGLYTDTCLTVPAGKISKEAKQLIRVTKAALEVGIKQVKPGNSLYDIGLAIENFVDQFGYGIVRDLVGHGVGYQAHEEPNVFNYAISKNSRENVTLKEGMVIAIEPMINLGTWEVKTAKNGYTVLTADNSLSAHFEHTIAVTKNGYEIITK
ncbi:type I methionyl aminopeptidase [Candidatus Falkowbacteria bacterium CG_4_10_14_0_2_um_filter_41_15]|uniref:Methionine aminopeptidase n=4 Tax=Candidatus Falkowiibacteriota TaxID=1752728 RepID=A0A2G9ZMA2_9BACT|nr:MAG: type I methionyl aminopeptidase [Candidatus Falkowbacteria bacterium CG1_02_41_21]PIP34306.1 MAG: type I methionyl aminopeptidase [Candidatus Falkowbacteria bacterium CG23_combo_of_CG06-09_8_20_14_all_41_10]PIZ11078.1 MAG: type I methionyl aminopeptidase [Candidatus Falkowbacteria bacterium CG_4_10_14_0_8_um_filter_41_36]PJA10062.1 MAG: type I methionyl aminopeptidase [Candidatus Falkowbacteria bacterium CG_4_10_14_0_2_um_filter_41_15]